MRVFGRLAPDEFGRRPWVVVETDPESYNDYVYLTALVQALKLNLGESPFYARFGIPAHASVIQQIAPDFAVAFMQGYYSQFFASLVVAKAPLSFPPVPTYNISIIRTNGSAFETQVAL
jgi:hypothetical protein